MGKKKNSIPCLYSETTLFKVLSNEELELLNNKNTYSAFKKNDIIYKEGDKPAGLIFLCEGKVKIFKEGVGGREQIIRMAKPLSFIGFRALFAEDNYIASALAIEDSSICIIDKDILIHLIKTNGNLALALIKELATELGVSNERTVNLTQKHIRGRLAESLLFLIDTFGIEQETGLIKVNLSREDIANLSNMTTSNAIRTLSAFSSEELIRIDGRKITVLNMKGVEKISASGS